MLSALNYVGIYAVIAAAAALAVVVLWLRPERLLEAAGPRVRISHRQALVGIVVAVELVFAGGGLSALGRLGTAGPRALLKLALFSGFLGAGAVFAWIRLKS